MNDPRTLLVARLTRPREEPRSVERLAGGCTAILGGHAPARPETIRVIRERFVGGLGLIALEYDDADDRAWFMTFGVVRDDSGNWKMTGAAGGGRSEPRSDVPWANLGCWWHERCLCAAGRVHGAGVRRVRLVAAGSEATDDAPEHGVALLVGVGRFREPWTVELYDAASGLLRRHPFHGGRPG